MLKVDCDTQKFIVLEGLEGAGKSTAIHTIKSWFQQNKPNEIAQFTREPGGTFIAEKIRELLITDFKTENLSAEAELLLMYASRMQHIQELILPALNNDQWVICDRFFWSSFAYQGSGRLLGLERVQQIHRALLGDFKPGLTIFLDLEPEIGFNRIQSREADRIESEKRDFFIRARNTFLQLANEEASAVIIDASQPLDSVKDSILNALATYTQN
ncbi:dTMP kinase [Thiotrichales bacterium 19S3-7]|nr:dTMP kinase [Thiotrichales bacterium 19S3-7]MCF6802910.1 dTMP kinase [Thiotrichales bacterium 19S3-11]